MIKATIYLTLREDGDEILMQRDVDLAFVPQIGMYYIHNGYTGRSLIEEVHIEEECDKLNIYLKDIEVDSDKAAEGAADDLRRRGWQG